MISRRGFVALAATAVAGLPGRARAQAPGRPSRVGYVGGSAANADIFVKALRELGHGHALNVDVVIHTSTESRQYADTIAKFVADGVDVVVPVNPYGLDAAVKATRSVPIVGLDLESDPVARGWVGSLARPGGNVTGIFLDVPEMSGKQLQLLHEAVPKLERVSILGDPRVNELQFQSTETAVRALRLTGQRLLVTSVDAIDGAIEEGSRWRAGGLVALTSPLIYQGITRVAAACVKHRLATVCLFVPAFVDGGGLLAYGPVFPDLFRRLAGYVDQVIRGARPAEMPIQRPQKFELAVNLKTARALKMTLPQSLVLRADRVIE